VVAVIGQAIETYRPALVVIACNTASTIALPALWANFPVPFVGTVPAIKPACAASLTRQVAVLGTEATVSREYTRTLIREFGQGCDVTLVGAANLATLAERELRGEKVSDSEIATEIAPCFVETGGRRTDTVVLACTHYPLLLAQMTRLSPWPVAWIDPAPAIARRVADLLGPPGPEPGPEPSVALFTADRQPAAALVQALAALGLQQCGRFDLAGQSA
jgi:glutamate racemase